MLRAALVALIRLYQRVSRRFPSVCRFRPSCSEYMVQALETHGVLKGLGLGTWRILRCNPLCRGGDDPVPPRRHKSNPTATDSVETDAAETDLLTE
ncbi:MAG: membrane protein insertion efficiency factor YidD [Armatimonadetes bacterium]|nr:membrane protein insertion efficiency factor YidD [Armatimonadota bacterium]